MTTTLAPRQVDGLEPLDEAFPTQLGALAGQPFSHPGFVSAWQSHSTLRPGTGTISYRASGRLLAAAPAFSWEFHIDKVLGPGLARFARMVHAIAPRYVHLPILCVGSPVADDCSLVIDDTLDAGGRQRAIDGLVSEVMATAETLKSDLIVFKDVPSELSQEAQGIFVRHGFTRLASLPVAVLDLPFKSFDEYLSSLDGRLRSELRRKMRQSHEVEVQVVDRLGDDAATVDRLMAETWARRNIDFEGFDGLTPGYAETLLRSMPGIAKCALTRHAGQVVGCNLFLEEGHLAIAFLIGMSGEHTRELNLYFVNWLWMVRHSIETGRTRLEFGQSNYALKQKLGCRLEPSWIYVRHRQRHWNAVTRMIASRVSLPSLDPDLKKADETPAPRPA